MEHSILSRLGWSLPTCGENFLFHHYITILLCQISTQKHHWGPEYTLSLVIHTRVSLRLKHLNNPSQYPQSIAVYNNQEHISLHTERERERERVIERESERKMRERSSSIPDYLDFLTGLTGRKTNSSKSSSSNTALTVFFWRHFFRIILYYILYCIWFTRLYVSVQTIYQPWNLR